MNLKDAKMYALVHNGSTCGCESISRLVQKHDIEANWNKAVNFRPLAGELIVYDVDSEHRYPRLKVGDGKTLVMDLPFFSEDAIGDLYNKLDKETQDRIKAVQEAIRAAADDATTKATIAENNARSYTDLQVNQERIRAEKVESQLDADIRALEQEQDEQWNNFNLKNGSGVNSTKQKPDGETFNGLQKGTTENNTTVEYNTDAAGQNSTILGGKNRAEAKRSTAIGGYNVAAGASSLATGEQTITEGRCSFTTGQRTRAKGGSSLASGGYSLALGNFSMTQGFQTKASGRSALATGAGTSAEGDAALSCGTGTKAIGNASVAFGNDTQSKGNYAAAFGSSTQANGVNSVAMGDKSIANAASSKVEGINNIANNSAYVAPTPGGGGGGSVEPTPPSTFNVEEHYGEGSHVEGAYNSAYGFAAHAEGLKVSARGHYSHAEGTATISAGESSHAEGGNTQANGKWSHAEGDSSIASNNGSHAEGKSQATGGYSHSEGSGTNAIGQGSHAEGRNTQATEDFSHAEGVSSVSSGVGSHAEGNSTASNTYAHSEGESTTASGENSHSQGKWTKAVGNNSTAVGISTTATGNNSFAGGNGSEAVKNGSFVYGFGLKSNQENQAVFGVYNAPYNATLLVVGNGSRDNYRTNAFEVYQDGRAKVQTAPKDNDDVVRKLELDTKYDKTGGIISGNAIITGDLTVNGTQHINNTENLNVENAMIYSNAKGATLATNGGVGIKKNATDVYGIVYDPTSDSVKLGLGKSDTNGVFTFNANEGQPVAIRDDSVKLVNDNLVKWDGINHKLVDVGKNVDNLIDKLPASLRNQAYVRNANGEDSGLAYTYTDEGNTLVVRNASGQLQVSTPSQDNDAANKRFVEDNLNSILYPVQRNTQYSTALLTAENIGRYYTFNTSVLTSSDSWVDPDNITVTAGTVVKILPIEDSHSAEIKPFFKIVGIDNRELYLTNGEGKCSIVKKSYGTDVTPKAIGYYSNVFSVDTDNQFGGQAASKYTTLFGANVRADAHAEGSIVGGRYCIVDSPYTFAYGRNITTQANQETITKALFGYNNKFNTKAILEIGNGTDSIKSNAFEVLKDSRAKVYGDPIENNDILRYQDIAIEVESSLLVEV